MKIFATLALIGTATAVRTNSNFSFTDRFAEALIKTRIEPALEEAGTPVVPTRLHPDYTNEEVCENVD